MNHTQILSGGVMTRQLWMNALNAAERTVQLEVAKMDSQFLDECGYPCTIYAAKETVASQGNMSLCVCVCVCWAVPDACHIWAGTCAETSATIWIIHQTKVVVKLLQQALLQCWPLSLLAMLLPHFLVNSNCTENRVRKQKGQYVQQLWDCLVNWG